MKFETNKDAIKTILETSVYVRLGLLLTITVIFTLILYPGIVADNSPYLVGDVAGKDIKSPIDFFMEDAAATEANKKSATEKVLTIYDYNSTLAARTTRNVTDAFDHLRQITSTNPVNKNPGKGEPDAQPQNAAEVKNSTHAIVLMNKADFEEKLGIKVSDEAFRILEKELFLNGISQLVNRIVSEILENGVVANKDILLREYEKGIILRDIDTQAEKIETNLKSFYGLDQAKTMVRVIGQPFLKDVNYNLHSVIVDFVQRLIEPNITLNINETEARKTAAASQIKPVLNKIKAGEMLLREGERVTEIQLLKLNALRKTQNGENILKNSMGGAMIILTVLLITYVIFTSVQKQSPLLQNKNLFFLSCIFITFFVLAKISSTFIESLIPNTTFSITPDAIMFGIPVAAGAMIVCLFMGIHLSVAYSLVISIFMGALFQNRFDIFLVHFLNSVMAGYWIQECRERKVFVKAGVKLGLLNILLVTVASIYMTDITGYRLLWAYAFSFLGGISAGIIASGLAPLIELTFGYTTDITLLELANLDRPILKRLMLEAPGTYHHSVIIGSLVEAAASAIDGNSLLAKVCGYYHDIGKINKPLYFIENQYDGQNRHNKLAPSMSSLILTSHVKEGVEIARKQKLGQVITDTIRQHHGTSLITFFYEKAKQLKGKDAVKVEDYRYPGPKPQTVEAGLVMLADVVEASSRTLENPTPARIQGHVQNQINKIFSDGQLDECELTLKDLHNIAKSFIKILNGIYHHRIDYPDKAPAGNGKDGNESLDRQQTKPVQSAAEESAAESTGHLKRLGQS
jgi:cyclic-di-AMP phosphodiesterase PgpH